MVVDATTAAPLAGVLVSLEGAERTMLTDGSGRFRFKGVHDGDGPILARLIGYATNGVKLNAGQPQDAITIALAASPVLLRGLEVVANRLHPPTRATALYSSRHIGPIDLAGVRRDWTVEDFLRARGYGPLTCGFFAPGPRRMSASQVALITGPAGWYTSWSTCGALADPLWYPAWSTGDRSCGGDRFAWFNAPIVVDNRQWHGGWRQLNTVRAYELYSLDVYDHGRGIVVYTKAWMIDRAADAAGFPPLELPPR